VAGVEMDAIQEVSKSWIDERFGLARALCPDTDILGNPDTASRVCPLCPSEGPGRGRPDLRRKREKIEAILAEKTDGRMDEKDRVYDCIIRTLSDMTRDRSE
jgi:hypothetical protein